ncbi:MAG: glycerophosphodiester phosphodiesterase [Flavobacteriales bacterium]|nr:glycerophosphodiester phosphodiesterase [Flavobacteriales bacterium]
MERTDLLTTAFLFVVLSACMPQKNHHPDIHGHRGCRGLLPENTIPAFLKATELGCDFLELDVVMSKDGQVIVSHEPWLRHDLCLQPNGDPIPEATERELNLYGMTVEEIQACDCASLEQADFPDQDQRKAHKPTLREVVEAVDEHALLSGVAPPSFNIEIKSDPALYDTFQPRPGPFASQVLATIDSLGLADRCIVQSFDPAVLEAVHAERDDIPLALLVEQADLERDLRSLTFTPNIYSPHFSAVDSSMLGTLRTKEIDLVVWTVNEVADIRRMLDLGVDGIISDYPDRVIGILEDQ